MIPPDKAPGDRRRDQKPDPERASLFARHEWTLVGLLAALAFVLGCIGYTRAMTFVDNGGPNTWWDVAYASLRLFIFEAPEETAGWPLYMQIARALAPMVVLYTAAKAVWNVIEEQVALYALLFRKRRFVVVCGIGETGFRIARDYCLNSSKRVVVIDNDPLNALAAELKNYGAIVVCGNAMDPLVLLRSQVIYAKELFLCTSDDKANIAIAKNAERLTRRLKDTEVKKLENIARRPGTDGWGRTTGCITALFFVRRLPGYLRGIQRTQFFRGQQFSLRDQAVQPARNYRAQYFSGLRP